MPSFDVVSKIDQHELTNAIDQSNREVKTRFDFKDSNARFELKDSIITMVSPNSFQLQQMQQILTPKLVKRGIDINCLVYGKTQESLHEAKQEITIKYGIDHEIGKKINTLIKNTKLKIQSSALGDKVRVTAKKRDDLQSIISSLKKEDFGIPLQFENFHD